MTKRRYFFAGGGTGGHIYPAIAVAQKIRTIDNTAEIHFLCSERQVDSEILSGSEFDFTKLPAKGLRKSPAGLIGFAKGFLVSCRKVRNIMNDSKNCTLIGVGGFVAGPAIWTAKRLGVDICFINVDIVPGKANRFMARFADEIFVQFEQTKKFFGNSSKKVAVSGCPLREEFENADAARAYESLKLDPAKKTLLITGASSGALNINRAICSLLPRINEYRDKWQIVHLTGKGKESEVMKAYEKAQIENCVLDYHDNMQNLLAAADIVVGRSGAVSVAEFVASHTPAICLPYPYHKDKHQYLNAEILVEAGAAFVVDDNISDNQKTAKNLWDKLSELLNDKAKRKHMSEAAKSLAKDSAAMDIAQRIVQKAKKAES